MERIKAGRDKQLAGVVKGDEARVEEGVQLGGEEETVENIEALGVCGAIGPWLGVAGA